jgi:hypothetical protein
MCICCKSPLRGYVVQILHDDPEPRQLKFRSLESFITALADLKPGRWRLDKLRCDFDGAKRTPEDVQTGRELLKYAEQIKDDYRGDAIRYGIQLLSEDQVEEIAHHLNDKDNYVVQSVRRRLRGMKTPRAAEALRQEEAEKEPFAQQCLAALKAAGIKASMSQQGSIRLDDGPIFLNFDVFFGRRRQADVLEDLVKRSKALLAKRGQQK